jgi:hypothetical protein
MIIPHFSTDGSLSGLKSLVTTLRDEHSPKGLVILGGIDNPIDEASAHMFFRTLDLPVGGALFPALITDEQTFQQGWLVYCIFDKLSINHVPQLSDNLRLTECCTAGQTNIVLVDGHARNISALLQRIYAVSDHSKKFIGGGAGTLARSDSRCIISNLGIHRDAAVIISIACSAGIGISHGWRPASDVLRVTSTIGNTVLELDYRPAFDVYADVVKHYFDVSLDGGSLLESASYFPLGIRRIGGEMIVRDPIATSETGGLICVGEFDSDCFVYVLTADMATLQASSEKASRQATEDLDDVVGHKLVFNCISRSMLMRQELKQELATLGIDGVPVYGALSIGEIASNSSGFLEFHNKTTAVAALTGA